MTLSNRTKNIILATSVFLITLALIELAFLILNRSEGIKLPYIYNQPIKYTVVHRNARVYHTMDPLLGYTYSPADIAKANFILPTVYSEGLAFYNTTKEQVDSRQLARPVILALGGSTTEPLRWGSSWPEELAVLMEKQNIKGTVINGGIGGYSSSQELLKLLRDGLEFSPDLVLTYHGVNEVGWIDAAHPLSIPYVAEIMDKIVKGNQLRTFFPNTRRWIEPRMKERKKDVLVSSVSKGVTVNRTNAQNLLRNVKMMTTVANEFGAQHISIMQPFSLTGEYGQRVKKQFPNIHEQGQWYQRVFDMYEELWEIAKAEPLPMLDFTKIFDSLPELEYCVYMDGCHVNKPGNEVVAQKMLETVKETGLFSKNQ